MGDLVVLIGVAITLIAFRASDRQNRALDSVNRLIEKSRKEFATYIEAHLEELQELDQNLRLQEKHAREVQSDIEKVLSDIVVSADRVQNLKDSLQKYDHLLLDLAAATERMDSTIIKVEQIRRDFEEDSNEAISAIRTQIGDIEGKVSLADREKNLTEEVKKLEEETASLKENLKTAEELRAEDRKHIEEALIKRIAEAAEAEEKEAARAEQARASEAVSLEDVLRASKKSGVQRAQQPAKPSPIEDPEVQSRIIDLRRAGNTCQEIADIVGANPSEVQKLLTAFEEEEESFESWESIKRNNFA